MLKEDIDIFFKRNYGKLLRKASKLKMTLWKDKRDWLKDLEEEDIVAYYYIFCINAIWGIKEAKDIEYKIYSNDFIQYLKFIKPLRPQEIYSVSFENLDKEDKKSNN